MIIEEIKRKLNLIASHLPDDPEAAESVAYELYTSVLDAIADGQCDDVRNCAREAVKAHELLFPEVKRHV